MAKNWLFLWWSKFIRIPFFLRGQMKRRARVIRRVLKHMGVLIYEKIPVKVLKEHRVTSAMRDQATIGKQAKKAEKAEFELAFDEEVEEVLTIREVKEIEESLLRHEHEHGSIGYESDFGKKVLTLLAIDAEGGRKIYFTYLEPIIRVAEKKGDYRALMEKIRLLGPSQTNAMAAIALRLEIRAASRGISKLRHDKKVISDGLRAWDKSKGNKKSQENHLIGVLVETEKDVEGALHNDALILKRDFLLTLLTLKYIDDDEEAMQEYYAKHVMPKLPEEERITDFEELKHKFAEDMHVLAQGMRRIFDAEKDAEKLAQQIRAVAHIKRRAAA